MLDLGPGPPGVTSRTRAEGLRAYCLGICVICASYSATLVARGCD